MAVRLDRGPGIRNIGNQFRRHSRGTGAGGTDAGPSATAGSTTGGSLARAGNTPTNRWDFSRGTAGNNDKPGCIARPLLEGWNSFQISFVSSSASVQLLDKIDHIQICGSLPY